MTELLFREDPRATAFTARVEAVQGNRVRLDRTLFYAEAGGQSADAGDLRWPGGAARVTDVQKDAGEVWHTLAGPLPDIGAEVAGELDWRRRYRHMQRHSAEHLLAQAFLRVNPAFQVRSVSMRSPVCTLDLAGDPTPDDARAAEALAMEVLARDLPIETFEVPDTALGAYPLRRPAQVSGVVRLVGVRDGEDWWELVACGGTHLSSTALAAPVVVTGSERVRGLTRVSFMAGEEATEHLGELQRQAAGMAQTLSVPVERLPERLDATLAELAGLRQALDAAREGWAGALLVGAAPQAAPQGLALRLLWLPLPELVTPVLKAASAYAATVTVALTEGGRCGVASGSPAGHAGNLLRDWLAASGGRGGGKAEFAQGQTPDPEAFEQAARAWADGR